MKLNNFIYIIRPNYFSIDNICKETNYSRSLIYKCNYGEQNIPLVIKEYLINNISKHIIELEKLLSQLKGE